MYPVKLKMHTHIFIEDTFITERIYSKLCMYQVNYTHTQIFHSDFKFMHNGFQISN